jgi:FkbM family methyltransferase
MTYTVYPEELVTNTVGRKFWIYKNDSFYQQRIAGAGPYQGANLKRLRDLCPQARTVIDVGMNIAMNTIEYATWAQDVHGFEPFPDTYAMALENITLNQHVELKGRYWDTKNVRTSHDPAHNDGWFKLANGTFASLSMTGNIHTHNVGLGEKPGSFQMENHPNNAGHNCILTDDRKAKTHYALHTVTVNTLDSYNFENVDIIKVDVEGYEFPVLKGAEQTIRRCRPVVQLEMVEAQAKRFGYTPQDIADFFINKIGGYYAQLTSRVYQQWLSEWSPRKHSEISKGLQDFVVSGRFRMDHNFYEDKFSAIALRAEQ